MINRSAIIQWNKLVPWDNYSQVEQDLIISRALVASLHNHDIVRILIWCKSQQAQSSLLCSGWVKC